MLRAVLDTNIFVSAFIKPDGVPGQLVQALLAGSYTAVLSEELREELQRALGYRNVKKYIRLSSGEIQARLSRLESLVEMIGGKVEITADLRDRQDLKVLAAAIDGRADVVVTGDEDRLVLRSYETIAIIAPREFLALLKRQT